MKEKLGKTINRFQNSQTSMEAYQAISDFVELIITLTEFIAVMEKEGEIIYQAKIELINHKRDYTNEYRGRQTEILHQLDPLFPLRNLHDVYFGLKPENITKHSYWMFRFFNPDKPMPETDKKEYWQYLDKVYKKALPFLKDEDSKQQPKNLKVKSYDETSKTLFIGNYEIPIAKNDGNNNAHEIMAYIFIDNKYDTKRKFDYSFIAEERFGTDYTKRYKYAHQPYSGACKRINDRIKDETSGLIKDFLIFNYSSKGTVQINPKYV